MLSLLLSAHPTASELIGLLSRRTPPHATSPSCTLLNHTIPQRTQHPRSTSHSCHPEVIALELDIHGCAELAKSEIGKHFERHKETLSNPGVAVNAALAAYAGSPTSLAAVGDDADVLRER